MTNGIIFHIFCLLIVSVLTASYFSKPKIDSLEIKFYQYLLIVNLIGVILHICCYVTIYFADVVPLINSIITKSYIVYVIMWISIFILYTAIVLFNIRNRALFILGILFGIFEIVFVLCTPLYYYHSGDVVYTYGPILNELYYMFYAAIFILIIGTLLNIKKVKSKQYIPLITMIIMGTSVTLIQQAHPQMLLLTSLHTFVAFIMYFTIENPDVKMIQQLNVLKDQADRANRAKSDFLSSMSHEIRTPLNAIVGFSECIKQEKDIDACYSDADDIIMASQNLLEIVNGILDISKIEANKMEIVVTNYRPKPIFENIAKLIVPRIGEKPIELNVNISNDLPEVLAGDAGKLKQITTNLLTNAVKYTEHGYINFDVKCINNGDECQLIMTVQDTGRGIKFDQMNRLFKKFERLDEDKNTTVEGTGLGLAITKSFIEMMGGTISVQSRYGEGSKFTVSLKQKIVTSEEEKAKLFKTDYNIPVINLDNKKILIVDDNNLNIKVCTKLLDAYNLDVTAVDSGYECIELLKDGRTFDLILMDDMMPSMSGTDTLIKIKQVLPEFNTPVVVLTANNIAEKGELYIGSGFDDCLGKPIEKPELHRVLTKFLSKKTNNVDINIEKEVITESNIDLTNKKILLVDDNTLNLKVAENIIKVYNPIIESVKSGQECLDKVKTQKYDLILMDDMMPNMTGTETMQILKNDPNFDMPIVVLTANAIEGAKESYIKAGFDYYLSKPIDRQELLKVFKKYIIDRNNDSNEGDEVHEHTKSFLKENGIDYELGLKKLNGYNNYDEAVKDFLRDIAGKMVRMSQYRLSNNMNNYAMEAHTLKSSAQKLGINKLADMAFNHELKSRNDDSDFINQNFDELMKEVSDVVIILKKYISVNKKQLTQ